MSENISLKDLLDTTFTINDKGEMVGEFTIKRINMIGDILTNYYNENERLNNIIKEVRNRTIKMIANSGLDFMYRQAYKDILEILDKENK